MKKLIKKMSLILVLATVVSTIQISPVFAANNMVHLVLGVGRTVAINQSSNNAQIEPLEKTTDIQNNFRVPMIINGSTYVPLRYILEASGFTVKWDGTTESTVIKYNRSGSFPMWVADSVKGVKKISVTKVEYKNDLFTCYVQNSNTTEKIKVAPSYSYFGKTYIPIRELERFEFIVNWDATYNLVHIYSDTTNQFRTAFEDIFKETNSAYKGAKASTYMNGLAKNESFYKEYEKYIYTGNDYNNNINNALALKTTDGLFVSNFSTSTNQSSRDYNLVSTNSRQLCYTSSGNKKWIYYINKSDKQIYKTEVTYNGRSGNAEKVAMPTTLKDKSFSQLTIVSDRIFFVAYTSAKDGGNVYMAKVGDELKTLVKITKNNVWNLVVSPDYQLYYTDFQNNCNLYSVDLKNSEVLEELSNNISTGIIGKLQKNVGVQSIAFSNINSGTYYYTNIASGAIMEVRMATDGTVKERELVKPSSNGTLFNFLNLYEANGEQILYYIEYTNGKTNNFDVCKIMAYDVYSGQSKTAYMSDKMIMQLTIVDKSIYFANSNYTKLYKLDITDKSYVFTELQ